MRYPLRFLGYRLSMDDLAALLDGPGPAAPSL